MNFKHSTTSMAIALMVLSLISVTSIQQDAFAQSQGMTITATADKGSDTITVTGQTISDITDVTFRVTSPSGNNVVAVGQISPDDNGEFATEFKVGPTWTEDGFYTISAMQAITQSSLYTLEVLVEVTNRMVEETSVTESNLETGLFKPIEQIVTRDAGIEISAETEMGSDTITITGSTDRMSTDITLTVVAPNGNVVSIDQVSPMLNGEFTSVITTGGPLWTQDGIYTVTAQQFASSAYTTSTEVDIKDGLVVPEFGTIAAMILAVSIISIIAISAKSRLSIMPRY
ncbi:MAG: PEFG-CTERM sorting domain-containing protein [Thaumarchaeota archaeon]|jgi:predicted secreted protein with PEFG-CTERM motif|nr:PEFG-CTERM sorting domain-containing protein [Nitrososphaerota archaeon]MBT5842250.1 PEFG-CTERM sorting domain-containing protein [Nitrososphaerota archaeon]MBT6469019.1 PEFG-CTERM sorting domain-containing protein [Nitrososphaerota archaeon]